MGPSTDSDHHLPPGRERQDREIGWIGPRNRVFDLGFARDLASVQVGMGTISKVVLIELLDFPQPRKIEVL